MSSKCSANVNLADLFSLRRKIQFSVAIPSANIKLEALRELSPIEKLKSKQSLEECNRASALLRVSLMVRVNLSP